MIRQLTKRVCSLSHIARRICVARANAGGFSFPACYMSSAARSVWRLAGLTSDESAGLGAKSGAVGTAVCSCLPRLWAGHIGNGPGAVIRELAGPLQYLEQGGLVSGEQKPGPVCGSVQ